jgi:DNA-binding MarR family transcriptional regulator
VSEVLGDDPRRRPRKTLEMPIKTTKRDGRREDIVEIVENLHRMFKAVDTFSRRTLKDFGVTGPQIWALRTIDSAGDMTIGELADKMFLHMSTVSSLLDRLETRKFLSRTRSTGDRRVVHLRLTPAGRAILKRAPEPPRSKVPRGLQHLGDQDLRMIHRAVRVLSRIMDVAGVEAKAEEG